MIALLKYAQLDNDLSIAPSECTFEHYADVRSNRTTGKYSQEYIALIGYCASYGGRYFDASDSAKLNEAFAAVSKDMDVVAKDLTIKDGIEEMLKSEIPEIEGVINIEL